MGRVATDPEPLPRDHPLLSLPNVTLTPHCAGAACAGSEKTVLHYNGLCTW